MDATFQRIEDTGTLHARVTRALAMRVIQADRAGQRIAFPNEAELCQQLGVSRSILREAVKVLADKGMVQVRPRAGMHSNPPSEWNLLDPDILAWRARQSPDARLLRDLCEVRLAIEPIAAGFAALRASAGEIAALGALFEEAQAGAPAAPAEAAVELELRFQTAVVAASHNPLFRQLNEIIREPIRTAFSYAARMPASAALEREARQALFEAIRRRDPLEARAASEKIVGLAMLVVEQVIRSEKKRKGRASTVCRSRFPEKAASASRPSPAPWRGWSPPAATACWPSMPTRTRTWHPRSGCPRSCWRGSVPSPASGV